MFKGRVTNETARFHPSSTKGILFNIQYRQGVCVFLDGNRIYTFAGDKLDYAFMLGHTRRLPSIGLYA